MQKTQQQQQLNNQYMKRFLRFLAMNDWLWGVPIAFITYWLLNLGPSEIGGVPMTYYAINWVQAGLATLGCLSFIFCIVRFLLWFNLRRIHHYLYGKECKDEKGEGKKVFRLFSLEDFKTMTALQRFTFGSIWLATFLIITVFVYSKFLSAGA